MRTRARRSAHSVGAPHAALVFIAFAIFVGVAAVPNAAAVGPIDASKFALPDEDAKRLRETIVVEAAPVLGISRDVAVGVAEGQYDPGLLGATTIDAYLAGVSVPGTYRGEARIRDRGVWIVKYSGMEKPAPNPGGEDRLLSTLYIFVDAETSEFLFGEWQE